MSPLIPIVAVAAAFVLLRGNKKPKALPPPPDGSAPGPDGQGGYSSGWTPPPEGTPPGPGKIKPTGGKFPGPKGKVPSRDEIVHAVFQWPSPPAPSDDGNDAPPPVTKIDPITWIKTLPATNADHDVLMATGIPAGAWLVNLRFSLRSQSMPAYGQQELLTYHLHIGDGAPKLEFVASKQMAEGMPITPAVLGCGSIEGCNADVRGNYVSFFEPGLRWAKGGLDLSFITRKMYTNALAQQLRVSAELTFERGGA